MGVQCPGPRKWETWAVRKQNPILLEGKRKLKNSWGKLIQNTHGFYLPKCSGRCIHSYKWVSVQERVPLWGCRSPGMGTGHCCPPRRGWGSPHSRYLPQNTLVTLLAVSRESRNWEGGSPKSQKCRWGGRGGSSWSQRSLCSHECFGRDEKTCCCDFLAVSWQHPWPKQGRGAPRAGPGQRRWERRRLMTQSVYNLNNDM